MQKTRETQKKILFTLLALCLMPLLAAGPAFAGVVDINSEHVGNAYGNFIENENATTNSNTLNIKSGGLVTGDAYGGKATATGDTSATALNNVVTISDGTVTGNVYGGYAKATGEGSVMASNNAVTISGGKVTGNVYGGGLYASRPGSFFENTVSVSGAPDLSGSTLYGGQGNPVGHTHWDNTLNLETSGLHVKGLKNFNELNFNLPPGIKANDTILYAQEKVDLDGDEVDLDGVDVTTDDMTIDVSFAGVPPGTHARR